MKYLRTYESHRYSNSNLEPVNEEIFGAIGKLFGSLFKKIKERVNKTKGGKEVEAIYAKYIKMINDEFGKLGQVDFNLVVATGAEQPTTPPTAADPAKAKVATENLKKIKVKLEQIIKKYKEMAIKEMDTVLEKMGGASKNPQLKLIIQSKKDEFDIAFMKAELEYLNKFGEKAMTAELTKQIDDKMKKSEESFKDFDKLKPLEIKAGIEVVYKRDKFDESEWSKLTEEDKKKTDEGKMKELQDKEMIGIKKVKELKGDDVSFEDADFTKKSGDILMSVGGEAAEKPAEQQDLAKKLGEMKTKKPEDMTKVSKFVDFISDEKNKDKVSEIEKIIGAEETK